jgi:glucose/arabinose dehydrogenase
MGNTEPGTGSGDRHRGGARRWWGGLAGWSVLASCTPAAGPEAQPAPVDGTATAHDPAVLGHHDVRFEALPAPFATPSADNGPRVVARPEGAWLHVPPGFHVAPYAEGDFTMPRKLAVAPNGDVFVADSEAGTIFVLRGIDAGGRARQRSTFATGLMQPYGLAFAPGWLYVGDTNAVVRLPYNDGDLRCARAPEQVAPLPGRGYHEHWTRNLLFAKDFSKLYVSVGSSTNVEPEGEPERASILEMHADGSGRRIYASGTRNATGMTWRGGALWAVVQERDGLGDDLVPDYLARIEDGAFYGWPFAYSGPHEDPRRRGERPELVARSRAPDLLFQAHTAVMDVVFYDGTMFPPEWRGDAIVSLHGSWNRSQRVGYELVRVHFSGDRPAGGYDDFLTGWMTDPRSREVWGRPVGLAVLGDGSLLAVDDGASCVWRITYDARP